VTTRLPALKGRPTTAQGNALSLPSLDTPALKGRHNPTPTGTNPHLWAHGSTPSKRPSEFIPRRGLRLLCNPVGVGYPGGGVTQGSAPLHPGLSPCAALRRGRARWISEDLRRPSAPKGQPMKIRGGTPGITVTCRRFRQVSASCRKKPVSSTCPVDVSKVGVLEEQSVGREKLFIHPKLMGWLTREPNAFTPYP
jgi:hypothetical protein